MATAKDILTLNKSKSILQRIGAMWSSVYSKDAKGKLGLFNHYHGFGSSELVDKILEKSYNIINRKDARIAVMNDFGLEVISRLIEDGFTDVCILCTEENDDLYSLIKFMIKCEFDFDKIVRLETNMSDKFDLVIANPPYEIGNAVITETMKHCEDAVVLMPFDKYKGGKLFQFVVDVDTKHEAHRMFDHAAISKGSLPICKLTAVPDKSMNDWTDFKLRYKVDPKYREYYELNQKLPKRITSANTNIPIDIETTFMISARVGDDGVHSSTDCYDYLYNVTRTLTKDSLPMATPTQYGFTPYRLNSRIEKDNMSKFWYNNPLMNDLIVCSHEQSSAMNLFTPRIDFSVERDYEHLTYKELLSIVKEEVLMNKN